MDGGILMKSFRLHEISEFERERFHQKMKDELQALGEIKQLLEDSFQGSNEPKRLNQQRAKATRLEADLKSKMEQIQVEKQLQVLTVDLSDMKKLQQKLKKRIVKKVDSKTIQEKLSFLEGRLEEEICQEECDLKPGFKSFPITSQEVKILLEA